MYKSYPHMKKASYMYMQSLYCSTFGREKNGVIYIYIYDAYVYIVLRTVHVMGVYP